MAGNETMPTAAQVGTNPNTSAMSRKQAKQLRPLLADVLTAIGTA